ncbi:MAG: META domain-containing protein [Betaproteobacteria bacterium]|jgi:heat shock protein HslJ
MKRALAGFALVALCGMAVAGPESAEQQLAGTEWELAERPGASALEDPRPTLAFPEPGRVAGSGSCNRFGGTIAWTSRNGVKISGLFSTRRACGSGLDAQESRYFAALAAATRLEKRGDDLLLHARGIDQPLRFTRRP